MFQILFWNFNFQRIIDSLFLKSANIPSFPVFAGSYWFVPVYIVSIIFASIVIKYLPRVIPGILISGWLWYLLRFLKLTDIDTIFLGTQVSKFLFYTCLILLGYRCYKDKINKVLFSIIFGIALTCHLLVQNNLPDFSLQQFKFPLSYIYVNASMISISLIFLLRDRITKFIHRYPCSLLTYLGKHSIDFYLSQGISSSLLFNIVPLLKMPFGMKLFCAFILKVIMAIIIGFVLQKILSFIPVAFDNIRTKTALLLKHNQNN